VLLSILICVVKKLTTFKYKLFLSGLMIDQLRELGLNENQAKVYIELTKRGSISAGELAKKLGINRSLTYIVLNSLVEKGLASHVTKNHKRFFSAAKPENIVRLVKEKEQIARGLLPELKNLEKIKEDEQRINVFEGKEGLKTFYEEILNSREKDLCFFGATGRSYEVLKYRMPHIAKEAVGRGLKGRVLVNKKPARSDFFNLPNVEVRYLPQVNSQATTTIMKNKVMVHILTDKPVVVSIENKALAKGYKSYFEFLWGMGKVVS